MKSFLVVAALFVAVASVAAQAADVTGKWVLTVQTSAGGGTPGNPMTADEVAAKALDLMAPILGDGRAKELIAAVYGLDTFGPVSGLRRLVQA